MSSLLQEVLTSQLAASGLKESDRDPGSSSAEPSSQAEQEHKIAVPSIQSPGHKDENASDDELIGQFHHLLC